MKRRILSVLLSLVMLIGLLPTAAMATTPATTPAEVSSQAELDAALADDSITEIIIAGGDDYTGSIVVPANKTLIINGGTFNCYKLIEDSGGGVTINNCTFTGTAVLWGAGGDIVINGGAFTCTAICVRDVDTAKITINSGTFNIDSIDANTVADVTIRGGTYSVDPNGFVPDGYSAVQDGDSKWTIQVPVPVAKIGGNEYYTIQAAIDDAQGGDVVTLIRDVTESNIQVVDGKSVIIDLNSKTLAGCFYVNGTATIKNGTIDASQLMKSAVEINSSEKLDKTPGTFNPKLILDNITAKSNRHVLRIDGGEATIKSGSYSLVSAVGTTQYVVNASSGATVTIEDGNFTGVNDDPVNGDYVIGSRGTGTSVTIKGGAFSVSSGGVVYAAEEGALSVSGGKYDQNLITAYVATGYRVVDSEDGWFYVVEQAVADAAVEEVDKAAADAKATIDSLRYLTAEKKTEKKTAVDVAAAAAKEEINKAGTVDAINAAKDAGVDAITRIVNSAIAENNANRPTSGSSSRGDYMITVDKTANGKVTVSPGRADKGDTVTITVKPDEGYELDELIVTDKDGDELKLTKNGKYTFTMPGSKVTVEATFAEVEEEVKTFSDVPKTHAFYDAVSFAAKEGIIEGYADGSFGIANPATVNAAVVVVARTMGQEFYGATAVADALAWAEEMELTTGLDLNGYVTREVYMILLWRAAGMPMADLSMLNQFSDANELSEIGRLAMAWAVENGLINGYSDGTVRPDDQITRGAMAAIAMRYMLLD